MVLNLDLAPTLLELAELEVPATMQGKSLASMIDGDETPVRDAWVYKYFEDFPYPVPDQTALRGDQYKLITYRRGKKDELFDLAVDPGEHNNLIDKPSQQQRVGEMRTRLSTMLETIEQGTAP